MHWILILYIGSYGFASTPHFTGDFRTAEACNSMLDQLQADYKERRGNSWGFVPLDGKCFSVQEHAR